MTANTTETIAIKLMPAGKLSNVVIREERKFFDACL